jgi:hypothetical protein
MAYDRYDSRRDRGRYSGEGSAGDRDYGRRDYGDRDERGFIERAGDEIRSWFGDDDDDRDRSFRGDRDEMMRRRRGRETGGFFGRDRGDDDGFFSDRRVRAPQGDRDYRPMTGDYGRARDMGRDDSQWGRDPYRRTSFARSSERSGLDPHYDQWRSRQLDELDRDYDEYRRENQSRFESEFGTWRERRQQKRQLLGTVREHMQVVGSDDEPIGTVDRVAGDRIILTKSDPESGGVHHSLSCSDIERIDGERVILSVRGEEARNRWRDESRDRALFEREDQGEAGPRMLDRSFSGTYR